MNPLFTTPLTTQAEAEGFIFQLVQLGLSFHPEDNASDIINGRTGQPLFTDAEAEQVNQRRDELFELLDDPCATMLDTLENWG